MLFILTLSVCLSVVLSNSSDFYNLDPPSQEVTKCVATHSTEIEKCSDAFNAQIKGVVPDYHDLMKTNPESLPDSSKKLVCCGFYAYEVCALKAVNPTAGCEKAFGDYLKKLETDPSVAKTCVKFTKGSTACA